MRREFAQSSERGFALVEVVVSAALLVVVALGVFAGIDGPSSISSANEVRTQQSSLAQQDQERMRSMPIARLIHYTATRRVSVAGVAYSVYSKAIWVRDASDSTSCTTAQDDTTGDYLKITSRVSPPAAGAAVELDSLMTPPPGSFANNQGTLAVQLKDQLDAPVAGEAVSITGPVAMTVPTNESGCAVFGAVDKGNYQITFSRFGWVDPAGVSDVVLPTSVTTGSTILVNHNYARAGTIHVNVDTAVGGTVSASPAQAVTVTNGGIPTGTLTFAAEAAAGQSAFDLRVYPFPSGYGVWAGACATGDPTTYGKPAVTAAPGPGAGATVAVRQPSIGPQVDGVASPAGAHVVFTSVGSGCSEKYSQTVDSSGNLPNPGVPYGTYRLCSDASNSYAQLDSFENSVPAGSSPTLTARGNGVCS